MSKVWSRADRRRQTSWCVTLASSLGFIAAVAAPLLLMTALCPSWTVEIHPEQARQVMAARIERPGASEDDVSFVVDDSYVSGGHGGAVFLEFKSDDGATRVNFDLSAEDGAILLRHTTASSDVLPDLKDGASLR